MREKKTKREWPLARGVPWALAGLLWGVFPTLPSFGQEEARARPTAAAGESDVESEAPRTWGWDDVVDALSGLRFASRGITVDREHDLAEVALSGGVDWTYKYRDEPVRVQADRILITVRNIGLKPTDERKADAPVRFGEGDWADFLFYAEGNVRLELPARGTYFEAGSLYYEHRASVGVATDVKVSSTVAVVRTLNLVLDDREMGPTFETPTEPAAADFDAAPFRFSAARLHFYGFDVFEGQDVSVSTCDYGVPHFAVQADSMTLHPIGEPLGEVPGGGVAAAGGPKQRDGAPRTGDRGSESDEGDRIEAAASRLQNFIVDPKGSALAVQGYSVLPFPLAHWDTRWNDASVIRSVEFGRSSQYGAFVGVDWNLNYLLNQIPLERFGPLKLVDDEPYLGFETVHFDRRGFGWGPNAEYGTKPRGWDPWQLQLSGWEHYGQAQYFAIDDRAEEDRTTRRAVPREDRFWGHIWHRQSVPHLGLFDFEYSDLSDRAFLGEYFESVSKQEKRQENLIYWRRHLRDNLSLTGLYQFRIDDFATETERLPEGKFFLLQQPVFNSGIYTDLKLQTARLRLRPDDDLGLSTRDFDRHDFLSEWAYPLGLDPYFQARPFFFSRLTHFGDVDDPADGSEDRVSFGTGVSLSQQWSRVFQLERGSLAERFFDASTIRHVVVPQLSYLNVFANNVGSDELIAVDATDGVDKEESFAISLTNEVHGRTRVPTGERLRPLLGRKDLWLEDSDYRTERIIESEVSFVLFPQRQRDNGGDVSSLLVLDNSLRLMRGLSARGYVELEPDRDFRGERIAASLRYTLVPGKASVSVGDRFRRKSTNAVFFLGQFALSDKWFFDGYYARDFEENRDMEYRFTLGRKFHRFVLSIEYEDDVGEDRNRTVLFNFSPLETFRSRRDRRRRW